MTRRLALATFLLAVAPLPRPAGGQEIAEHDLYFSDPANLAHLLEGARDAFTAGDLSTARGNSTSVIEVARQARSEALRPVHTRALLLRAEIALRGGDRKAALADLAEALDLDPGAAPERSDRSAFATLWRGERARTIGSLAVDSDPPGATVSIAGRTLGQTPLASVPVASGTRYVKVERPGFAPAEREVTVGKGARTSIEVALERRSSTFLLLTDADGATVTIDGELRGTARRPDFEEASRLIAVYNSPIDPTAAPALFLWPDAAPGTHRVELAAPCRRSARRQIEIPESADATTFLPLEKAAGRLVIQAGGAIGVSVDGKPMGWPPVTIADACPGVHRIQADGSQGRTTAVTVEVRDGEESLVSVRFLPVIAWLGGDERMRQRLAALERFNLFDARGLSGALPGEVLGPDGAVRPAGRDLVAGATGADLLAWTAPGARGPELVLLATTSTEPDRVPIGSPAEPDRAAADLDRPIALFAPDLGLAVAAAPGLDRPLVAALAESGPAARAGLRIGDEITALADTAVSSMEDYERIVSGLVPGREIRVAALRPSGEVATTLTVRQVAVDFDPRLGSMPANAVIARIDQLLAEGHAPETSLPYLHFARGKSHISLGQWERAYADLAVADLPPGDGVGRGTQLYYRALAMIRTGRSAEARQSLTLALKHPGARIIGPDGPLVLPLVRELIESIPPDE